MKTMTKIHCNGLSTRRQAQKKAMRQAVAAHGAELVFQEFFRAELPRDLRLLFGASFGGLRNMALGISAKIKSDLVFVDDDTTPENHVFRKHGKFLNKARVVVGKYAGHVAGQRGP